MESMKLYFRQFLAMIPASLLTICGGFHLAYGIFNSNIGLKLWTMDFSIPAISMVPISFHIMTFIGGAFASFSYKHVPIYKIHLISAALMMCGAVTFFISENIFFAILSARILLGFGFGSSSISTVFYISEISSPKIRAHCMLFQHLCLTFGMFLHSVANSFGVALLCIILISVSFPIGYYTMKESHVFLMMNDSKDSFDRFKYFQSDEKTNLELEHDTIQSHLIEEERRSHKFFGRHNILTLLIIIMVQNGYISIFNAVHNYLRLIFMRGYLMQHTETLALTARIFGICLSFSVLNVIPKKFHYSISGIVVSAVLSAFGAVVIFYYQLWLPVIFFMIVEFLLGLGIGGMAEILKSELLPIKERPWSMAVACFCEEALQVVGYVILYSWALGLGSNPIYWPFVFSGVIFVCCVVVLIVLKDSRKESLVDSSMTYAE